MSLQVWLPLNGSLLNLGLSDITVTNNGAIIDNNGKIGKCYNFTSGKWIQTTINNIPLKAKEISFACWINVSSWNSSYDAIMSIANGTGWNQSRATLSRNNTASTLTWNIADNSTSSRVSSTTAISLNTWYHIATTYDGTNLKIYINGILDKTASATLSIIYAGTFNIGGWSGNNYPINAKINDVRIYNHCLSKKEIEELAKGLVFHYKFDETNSIMNLHYDRKVYIEPDGSSWIRVFHHNDPTTSGLFNRTDPWDEGVYLSNDKWFDLGIIRQMSNYEFMIKQKTTSSVTETKYRWIQTPNPFTATYNDVKPGTVTFNTSTGYTNSSYGGLYQMNSSARMCIANNSSGNWYGALGSWSVYNTNLVPGFPNTNISTGYIDLYVRLDGYILNNIIYDSSGYNYNATIIGPALIIGNTAKYLSCLSMNNSGTANHIESNNEVLIPTDGITACIWVKSTKSSNHVIFAHPLLEFGTLNSLGYVNLSSSAGWTLTNFVDNLWNFITVIRQGTTYKLYVNGKLETLNGASNYYLHSGNKLYFLNRNYNNSYAANALISDFRMYATVLTETLILELYNTSMSVDKKGNIYMREALEI